MDVKLIYTVDIRCYTYKDMEVIWRYTLYVYIQIFFANKTSLDICE